MIKRLFVIAAIATSTAFFTGCASRNAEHSKVSNLADDARITTQIKAKYAESPVVRALVIRVDTDNGHVTLSGNAKNSEEKIAAESIARSVSGVRSVKNNIVIQP